MTSIPRTVARVAELMSTFRPWWALCGGWAVDAWMGEQTRDHVDIDIATFADDQRAMFEQVSGWNLIADDAIVVPISSATTLSPWGIPTVVPKILLFYKGTAYLDDAEMTNRRSHDDVDFQTLRDQLDRDERTWLRDSISRLYSNHPWLERLSDKDQDQEQDQEPGLALRRHSGYRDRRARPSDPAGGA